MEQHIYFAKHNQFYVLKMLGSIRFTDCSGFRKFHQLLNDDTDWNSLIVDLTELSSIDSTALGLIAGCAILSKKLKKVKPTIFISRPDIEHILSAMRFEQAFDIRYSPEKKGTTEDWKALEEGSLLANSALDTAREILQAHQYLVQINEKNRHLFQEVIDQIKEDLLKKGNHQSMGD